MRDDASAVRVGALGAFDVASALSTLKAHEVRGIHVVDTAAGTLERFVAIAGEAHRVLVRLDPGGVRVRTDTDDEGVWAQLLARVRRWFDLDTDIARVDGFLGRDPVFAGDVRERPGVRITRFHAPFEGAVLTVLGQQVSLAAGRTFAARLVEAFGVRVDEGSGEQATHLFPTARRLAGVDVEALRATVGLTASRAGTVHDLSVLVDSLGGRRRAARPAGVACAQGCRPLDPGIPGDPGGVRPGCPSRFRRRAAAGGVAPGVHGPEGDRTAVEPLPQLRGGAPVGAGLSGVPAGRRVRPTPRTM